jgi:hypothetical protein
MFSGWTYAGFGLILGLAIQLVINFPGIISVGLLIVCVTTLTHFIIEDYKYWIDSATNEIIARDNMLAVE